MRNALARRLVALGNKISSEYKGIRSEIPEITDDEMSLLETVHGLSMTSKIAQWEFIRALRYVENRNVPGDIVECGVWRGGNLALAGLVGKSFQSGRKIWAFDTFSGMTAPTQHDAKAIANIDVDAKFKQLDKGDHNEWCYASLEDVKANFATLVSNAEIQYVKGPVQETLLDESNLPKQISVLRLDTDFYDSTKAELEILYPRLSEGGVLIVDDYGEWAGARKAVDEYFTGQDIWLQRVTHTVRFMIKGR